MPRRDATVGVMRGADDSGGEGAIGVEAIRAGGLGISVEAGTAMAAPSRGRVRVKTLPSP